MNSLSQFFYKRSTLILGIIATMVSFGFLFLVVTDQGKCFEVEGSEGRSLGLNPWYTMEMVQQFFSERTDSMLRCYRIFGLVWDNLFAITYGVMNAVWISLLFNSRSSKFGLFNLFPFLQTIMDFAENFMLGNMAISHIEGESLSEFNVTMSAGFTLSKWLVYGIVMTLILVGIVLKIVDFVKRKKD